MMIPVCDFCNHTPMSSMYMLWPTVYQVGYETGNKYDLMLCAKCRDRLIRVITMESRKEWKKELKGMRT